MAKKPLRKIIFLSICLRPIVAITEGCTENEKDFWKSLFILGRPLYYILSVGVTK